MGRPKTPLLNPKLVVRAALQIIDADGLDGLSVRRLADEFNVNDGSLYHHLKSKDDILRRVARAILLEVEPPDPTTEDWVDLVIRTATGFRRVLLRHHKAIPLILRFEPDALVPSLFDPFAELLGQRGVPTSMARPIVNAFGVLVMGSAAHHHAQLTDGDTRILRSRAALRDAEEIFEDQCRTLALGFQARIDATPASASAEVAL